MTKTRYFGPATTHHNAIEMLKRAAGINLIYVPFPGGANAITNLGGHINVVQANHADVKENLGQSLRGLAVGSREC